ncbi:MAG: hypothetical protein H6655_15050 [Ardenticatenaceae bacterium]|nr:hypothetical protein [Ardenticatenaceae bacterium]
MNDQPATTQEIFQRLQQLTDKSSVARVEQVATLIKQGEGEAALEHLYEIDETIGGFGLHTIRHVVSLADLPDHSVEDREIHRPIQYVRMILRGPNATELTRFLVDSACGLVEVHLKRLVKFGFLENFFNARKPMGWLLDKKFRNKLPQSLFEDLFWLNNRLLA